MPRFRDITNVFGGQVPAKRLNQNFLASPKAHFSSPETQTQTLEELVVSTTASLLGPSAFSTSPNPSTNQRGVPVFDILTSRLHFTPHHAFWWRRLAGPFASMLQTGHYSTISQCKFLCFVYGTVIGLLPSYDDASPDTFMTVDGSPIELSWVLPDSPDTADSTSNAKSRQVRFAIEPINPVNGKRLKGSVVLDYLTSPRGGMGLVQAAKNSMTWRSKTEEFLFPDTKGDDIPDGSRFFVGFDFMPSGTIGLKAYYLPGLSHSPSSSLKMWDVDYTPLRNLVASLDPALVEPMDLLLSYFESLEDDYKPRIEIISMDCVKDSENRLKIYCRPPRGSSWSDAARSFTLGGRLNSPQMDETLGDMERLWNNLFPHASSQHNCDLHISPAAQAQVASQDTNGIALNQRQHPVSGLLYYYSVFAGKTSVYPKLYLPVSQYCSDDLTVSRAVEEWYRDPKRRGKTDTGSEDWVAREVASAYNHRPLHQKTGIHTYVTFALKKNGSELTPYFSPEPYQH